MLSSPPVVQVLWFEHCGFTGDFRGFLGTRGWHQLNLHMSLSRTAPFDEVLPSDAFGGNQVRFRWDGRKYSTPAIRGPPTRSWGSGPSYGGCENHRPVRARFQRGEYTTQEQLHVRSRWLWRSEHIRFRSNHPLNHSIDKWYQATTGLQLDHIYRN
jgi:hypothetical protein